MKQSTKLLTMPLNQQLLKVSHMFVKEAYDSRLRKQEEESAGRTLLRKAKNNPNIGSIRNDKINYDRDEQFFTREDVPMHVRQTKQRIKDMIDPDHLGLRKRNWNASVSVPKKIEAEETHEQRLLKIKLGFLDHPLPKYKEFTIPEGTDTRDDYSNWNVSNQLSKKQIKQNLMKKTVTAFENTKNKQRQYLKEYLDPLHKTSNFIESFKNDWKQKQELREELRKKYEFDNPNPSVERTNGAVFRMVYETINKQTKDEIEAKAMKTNFKATLSETQKSRIGLRANHTGVWQCFKEKVGHEEEETWAWSCCRNEDKDSFGCSQIIKDGNKWNLMSFNC